MAGKSFFHTFFFPFSFQASIQFVQHVWEQVEIEFMVARDGEEIGVSQPILWKDSNPV